MGLEEFGSEVEDLSDVNKGKTHAEAPIATQENKPGRVVQWSSSNDEYIATPETRKTLPSGLYSVTGLTQDGKAVITKQDINVDDLLRLHDDMSAKILKETDEFWERGSIFRDYGMLHRRGFLLYGPAGSGKTAIVQQIIADIVKRGGVVFLCSHPHRTLVGLKNFRAVEPDRKIVCVFEDIDAIIREYGEEDILSLLDGENQLDTVLNLATSNYPEKLDPRIVCRPRRFDRVIKIDMPSEKIRRQYLTFKLKDGVDVGEWVKLSEDFSFAAMAEMVISVECLGNTLEDTVKTLREMAKRTPSSDEFKKGGGGLGIKANGHSVGGNPR